MRNSQQVIAYLNNLRQEQHVSISELARRVNMSKSTVSLYFKGTREFPVNRLDEFAKALHTTPEDVLGVNDNSKKQEIDLADSNDDVLFTYQGKPLTDLEKQMIRRLMDGKSN